MKKYAVYPGEVMSKNDGDIHFISAGQLMQLYRVNPKECVILTYEHGTLGLNMENLVELHPRYDGDYTLPSNPATSLRRK